MNIKSLASPNLHKIALTLLPLISSKKTILDAGAGEGALSGELKKRGFLVSACDLNCKQFKVSEITCKKVDLNKVLPYEDETFDYLISIETIEHLENPWNFIRESKRVLKNKGQLIISTPNISHLSSRFFYLFFGRFIPFWSDRYIESNWHINPIFSWELDFILKKNGFNIINKIYNEGKLFPIFKLFLKDRKIFFGEPVSVDYLPKNSIFGENLIIQSQKK